ncbi:histidine kinase [Rubrivivax gelatinosus]|nr:histidine kinase [Rubrivivax gelatinosus]
MTAPEVAPEVARRAVQWLVDLQSGQASERTRRAHQAWLARDPEHARAWAHIEAVNQRLRSAAGASAIAQATLAPQRSRQRRRALEGLAVLLFAGGAAWQLEQRRPWHDWLADERTGVGERRTLTLADGSELALNTDSALQLRFSAVERRLLLLRGELLLSTGADPGAARPLVVETEYGELRPLGTRFGVRLLDDACRVDVFDGAVALLPAGAADRSRPARVLQAGERACFTRTGVGATEPAHEADSAWSDGVLAVSGLPLAEFLAELGRHRRGHLGCDAAVAGLRVSGTYPLADTERVLDLLRSALPVEIHYATRWWVTVRPARR